MARLRAIETRRPIAELLTEDMPDLFLLRGKIVASGLSPTFTRSARCHNAFSPRLESPFIRWGKYLFIRFLLLILTTPWFWNYFRKRASEQLRRK